MCALGLCLSQVSVYADIYSDNHIPTAQKRIIEKMVQEPSVFTSIPGLKRKPKQQRINDLIKWYKQNGNINPDQDNFNKLGLDIANFRDQKDFMSWTERNKEAFQFKKNGKTSGYFGYDSKFKFYKLVSSVNPKYTPKVLFILKGRKTVYSPDNKIGVSDTTAINKLKDGNYVIKPVYGMQGQNAYFLKKQKGKIEVTDNKSKKLELKNLLEKIKGSQFIFQEYVYQHPKLKQFHENSLNTIRVVSLNYGDKPDILAAMFRIGAQGVKVDNAHQGGTYVGVDIENGKLRKYGYSSKNVCTQRNNVKFENFQIPLWKEAMDLVKELHSKAFPGAVALGFDVAITENGPVVIEVNTGWVIAEIQACNEGLKDRYMKIKAKQLQK